MNRTRKSKSSRARHEAVSSDTGHLTGPWQGHFPVTSIAVMSLLDRVIAGEDGFSPAERVLFVASEFWSAFNAAELDVYFDLKAKDPTLDTRLALQIIGATHLASLLESGVLGPPGGRATRSRRKRLAELETRLRASAEPMDLLLARFAWRYMTSKDNESASLMLSPPEVIESSRLVT